MRDSPSLTAFSAAVCRGFRRGVLEALVGFWTPLRPRFWRYVASESRRKGTGIDLVAFFEGYTHVLAGRLAANGQVVAEQARSRRRV